MFHLLHILQPLHPTCTSICRKDFLSSQNTQSSFIIEYLLILRSSGRFRGGGKNGGAKSPGIPPSGNSPTSPTGPPQASASSTNLAPRVPPLPNSPSLSQTLSMNESTNSLPGSDPLARYNLPQPKPLWLNDAYAKHIVKGNFMTLSRRPWTVEPGEWIAHQGKM